MKPYGILSDTHNHAWSAFAETTPAGVNSRLQILLDETERCASELRKAGGHVIIHGGDLFHVRGSLSPSVLNPTMDCYRNLINNGFEIVVNAGNHDLEGKAADRIGSAITALEGIGCHVINSFDYGIRAVERVILIPWTQNIQELKELIDKAKLSEPDCHDIDLILHAPIDGVIDGIPPHGLDAGYLKSLGFRRVFCGHYHHHKDFGDGIYSIGALAHHTWSDIGTKAGFLIVSDEGVKWYKSHAPEFVEITAGTDPDEVPLIVDGNYVRAKLKSAKQSDVEDSRQFLMDSGAKGVIVIVEHEAAGVSREGVATVKAGASLEVSVADFIKAQGHAKPVELAALCHDILTEARANGS